MVVVDSGVSESAFARGVSYAHAAIVSSVHCAAPGGISARRVCAHGGGRVVLRAGGEVRCKLLGRTRPSQRSRIANLGKLACISERPPTMLQSPPESALTGTFWRFDGRLSFSGTAAPPALRFAALSMAQNRSRVVYPSRNRKIILAVTRMARVQLRVQSCLTLNTEAMERDKVRARVHRITLVPIWGRHLHVTRPDDSMLSSLTR